MNNRQILVRSIFIEKLREIRAKGLWLGKFQLATPEDIEREISRREVSSRGNYYLNLHTRGY